MTIRRPTPSERFDPGPPDALERLLRESERERRQGEALAEIARAISSSLRLADVMRLSLRHGMALLRATGASLSLLRDDRPDELVVVAAAGDGEGLEGAPLPLSSVTGRSIRERRAMIVNDPARDPETYGPTRIAANVENTVVAPLFSSTAAIGALAVMNRAEPFTDDDAEVLQRLADQVAVAVTNARLYEASQLLVAEERRARDAVATSEARYRNLFESASDAIYTLDEAGSFTSVNQATCQLTGRQRDELVGRSPLPFVASRDATRVQGHFRAALAGTARGYECEFVRPDGSRRLVSVTNTPIRHADRVIGVLGVARDITEERERALALERSEARYTRLVESATDAIFTVDAHGRITGLNRALVNATGRERADLMGLPFTELVEAGDRGHVLDALNATLHGQRRRVELRYPAATGETRQASLTLTPVLENGGIPGALGIVRDVTDERRLAEQLMQQEKLAAIGQLVSGVAHELNNPLASVGAFAQLLLAAPSTPEQRHAIETIEQEARRAAKIVSNLLTFARQHQPERTAADLNRVVADTVDLRRYAVRTAEIELELRLDPDLPITWADPYQLQQVVLNLVTNAEQALDGWQGTRRIVVRTDHAPGTLRLSVSDTGPGIAPEHLSRIFNPFFTTKPVGQGTGLGLSISDGIVREHGGRIRAESQAAQGATFTVELPHVTPPTYAPGRRAGGGAPAVTAQRLLVIDDEAGIRAAVQAFFRSLGHTVDAVATGREGIAMAARHAYDALIVDLRLSDTTGDRVLDELRLLRRELPRVVFITGDTHSEESRALLDRTGCPVLSKPFLLDDLAAVVLSEASDAIIRSDA